MESKYRLYGLPPQSNFIAVEALEYAAVEVGKTQEAMGQLANSTGTISAGMFEVIGLILLYTSFAATKP